MIVRKPYAFLIKNFRKIHIALLLVSLFVAYKLIKLSGFISEFMKLGIYDSLRNPISNYINWTLVLCLLFLVVGSASLVLLLRYKQKPWKLYLISFVEYLALIFVLSMIKGFFTKYTYGVETTDLRFSRDLLLIFLIAQLPCIGIFVMRILGMDSQKFDFNADKEFLELSEEDREEIEISVNVDINTFKRLYKRGTRNIKYLYDEHKSIFRVIFIVLVAIIGINGYKFIFINNKSYSEGDIYSVNGFSIKVNNSYFTDKDKKGEVISNDSNFVIIDFTIQNNGSPRKFDMNKFHLKNSIADYTTTEKIYASEFEDLGKTYDKVTELKRDEKINFIAVYKVNKKLKKNGFTLYYQEKEGRLRKIRLNIKDLSNIKNAGTFNLGDDIELNLNPEETISFNDVEITDSAEYVIRKCVSSSCTNMLQKINTEGNYKILEISFSSDTYQAKNMIDFLTKYGKIIYKDSSGSLETLEIKNPIQRTYYGKTIYLKAPNDISDTSELNIEIIVRNKKYVYKLI